MGTLVINALIILKLFPILYDNSHELVLKQKGDKLGHYHMVLYTTIIIMLKVHNVHITKFFQVRKDKNNINV